ncbi:MAG: GAF domain-containing protein [Chloroflexota bacterium]
MSNESILIIDDSREVVDHLAADVLPEYGYNVQYAYTGQAGLALIRSEQPDLILLDYHLPQMTGLDILQEMVLESINIPVILMTGYGSELSAVQAFRLGAKDYLVKPFTIDEIVNMIDRALVEKRLQHDNEKLTEEVRRLKGELTRQSDEMKTLFDIGKAITSFLSVHPLMKRVEDAACEMIKGDSSHIWIPNKEGTRLQVFDLQRRSSGVSDWRVDIDGSDVGQVYQTGRPFRQSVYSSQKIVVTKAHQVQSLMAVPLKLGKKIVGVLSVCSHDVPLALSKRDEFLLSFLADYAAIALENARIFQETDQALADRLEELNTLIEITHTITSSLDIQDVLSHTIQHVHESWDIEASSIWWLNSQHNTLKVLANVGTKTDILDQLEVHVGQGIVGRVVELGKQIYVNDVAVDQNHLKEIDEQTGFHTISILCVPLTFQDKVVGAMQLLNKRNDGFDEQDVARAASLASVVAIAVMNAKMFGQTSLH